MASALIEDLPSATSDFLHRRARRAGAATVTEHVRHELITLAREPAPIDNVVQFLKENHARPPQPEVDQDAMIIATAYDLPADVWNVLCLRAAASNVPVSVYVHDELVALSRRSTIEDVMWEFGEAQNADPSLDIDMDAVLKAARYARGLD